MRLDEVADVSIVPKPERDPPRNASRARIDVGANVDGTRDLGSVANDDQGAARAGVEFPLGYHAEVLGEYVERQAAQRRMLLGYALITVIGIFLLLLHRRSGNVRLAALAFVTLPMALVGGVLAAYLDRRRDLARLARRVLHGARDRARATAS